MTQISRSRLIEILEGCRSVRVGVIGDFNLDGYWYADMTQSQISREAPLFPRPVVREQYTPGGAANVAWNLAALGLREVRAFTLMGLDWRRDLLAGILEKLGVRTDSVIVRPDWMTPFFGKIILTANTLQQEDARVDFINPQPITGEIEAELLQRVREKLPELDALIVADYAAQGVLTPTLRQELNRLAVENPRVKFVADSRDHIASFGAMIIKPNEIEAARGFFAERDARSVPIEEIERAAVEWNRRSGQAVVITLGEQGCLLVERGERLRLPGIQVPPPIDTVGAGDTFVASLAGCLAAGAQAWEACAVANLASAVTIQCLRVTGSASPEQIVAQYDKG